VSLERVEIEALADFVRAAPRDVAERAGIELLDLDGAVAVAVAALPGSRMFNRALGVASAEQLDRAAAFFAPRSSPHFVAAAQGVDLEADLQGRGYRRDYAWMKFRHELAPVEAASGPRVEQIGAADGETFGTIVATAFEAPAFVADWSAALPDRPGWACFLSYSDGDPVGAACLFLREGEGWLGFDSTLPEHRGRGSQQALLAARIELARRQGCEQIGAETGERTEGRPSASYRNILRAGFSEAYLRPNWVSAE
jgi:GNAT superfamily N-acetyltransferase